MSDVDNFLAHYGVKGMRWGVRRKKNIPSVGIKKRAKSTLETEMPELNKMLREVGQRQVAKIAVEEGARVLAGILLRTSR